MTRSPMRRFRLLLLLCAIGSAHAALAQAPDNYPSRPVRLITNFAAGGAIDAVARAVGARLAETMGQPFVVDNRPGAGGNIGADAVAKAKPDGYTLLVTLDTALTVNPSLYGKLPFDPARDFAPISLAVAAPLVLLTRPGLPAATLRDFVALARAKPKALSFASAGTGTAGHLAAALLAQVAGFDYLDVAYKGGPQAITDVAADLADFTVLSFTVTAPMIKAGKLRAVAITGSARLAAYPELPTVAESGYPGYEVRFWIGLLAPAGTPRPLIARLNGEIVRALQHPQARDLLAAQNLDTVGNSPEEFAAVIEKDTARWSKIIRESGARAN